MDSLKNPAIIISVVSVISVLGATAWLYTKVQRLDEDITSLTESVEKIMASMESLNENNTKSGKIHEAIIKVTGITSELRQKFNHLNNKMISQEETISLIIQGLSKSRIPIDLPQLINRNLKLPAEQPISHPRGYRNNYIDNPDEPYEEITHHYPKRRDDDMTSGNVEIIESVNDRKKPKSRRNDQYLDDDLGL